MKEMVILTGFAGFIGSQIVRDLLKRGYFVVGIDNLGMGAEKSNFIELENHPDFKILYEDIADPELYKRILGIPSVTGEEMKYIISCAAESHVDRCYSEIDNFIRSNINGPINLAKMGLKFPHLKKFVQVSTDEVWGEAPQPFTETAPLMTGNAYASSKAAAELFLHNYFKAYKLPLVITNGANTYGPRQAPEKVIPKTIFNICNKIKVPLFKTPAKRMWLHVEDHSDGIIKAMEKGVSGEKYCLAPNIENELETHVLVRKLCEILKVSFDSAVEMVPDRPNYDLRYYMRNDYAKLKLGWNPSKNIETEISGIVQWYVDKYGRKK
jgi:dTDP-glucose 4,6-dehydratase